VYDPNLRKRAFYRLMLPRSKVIISNSVTGGLWLRQFYGVRPDRVTVVPNGLDPNLLEAVPARRRVREELAVSAGAPLVVFVGKVNSHKGLPFMVRVFRRVLAAKPEAHLVLVGHGLTQDWVREEFGSEPHVHGLGTRNDIYDLIGSADALLMTSPTEGFPNCVLEAMALGVPPVTTRVGECPSLIDDGEDGYLYDYGDEAAGARRLLRVLEDPGLRRSMSRRGRTKILERYGTRAMVAATVQVYERVLGRSLGLSTALPHPP
jgi:glycosyltransferase involved in cell wall biosynthesis